jgi:DNA-binding transcriptional regulator/RsmH inhibitor MraZ
MSELGHQSLEMKKSRPIALMGRYLRPFDQKRRLTIPSVWRDALGPDSVYVLPDPQRRILQLIPKGMLEARLEELQRQPISDAKVNEMLDAIGAASELVEFDVQGRIRIKDELLAYAHLDVKGSVECRGSVRMVTIWPAAEKTGDDMETRVERMGAAMASLGL